MATQRRSAVLAAVMHFVKPHWPAESRTKVKLFEQQPAKPQRLEAQD
jgi:hypothetical protein